MKINGQDVVDAKRRITINIGANDIRRGSNKDPGTCAAALACLREIPGCEAARVHVGRTYVLVGNKWLRLRTSEALRGEIISFDRGGGFQTGEYVLLPMPASQKLGKRQGSNALNAKQKGRKPKFKRTKPHIVAGIRERLGGKPQSA